MLTLSQRVKRVRAKLGENQGEFGKRFGVDQSTIAKWESGRQVPKDHRLDVLADLETEPEGSDATGKGKALFTMVPVRGEIGAGAEVYRVEVEAISRTVGYIKAPRGFGAVEALRVRGNSMWPVYRDGDLIFIENKPSEFPLKRDTDYVVELADGRSFLKMVEPANNGRYNLIAYNGAPERDVEIVNAVAVRYIRRTAA